MENVNHKVTGDKLVIEVDLSPKAMAAARPSKTGATKLLATTSGAVPIPSNNGRAISFSLNVMLK